MQATQVSAGYEHSLALGGDGNAYAWGWNHYGLVDWTLGGAGQPQAHLAYTYEGVLPLTGGNGSMIILLAA
ncbi:RCC1 domain-containing protein, partial [Bifidobacterium sp. H6bp22N]|uniref:RCC1-like domain-containing protein n=1 Tax=Bifidobacterium polysaccharolyticum TaxID=2750967 RepID=UPI0028BE2345